MEHTCEIPDRLHDLMRNKHCSLKELAKETGISYSAIVMYCRGERHPSRKNQEILADYFNCDIDYLMGRSDVKRSVDLQGVIDNSISSEEVGLLAAYRKAPIKDKTLINIILNLM